MTYRRNSFLTRSLIVAATFLTHPARSEQIDDRNPVVTEEKANSISAAMESSLEGLPRLYQLVSKSIVRVETPDNESTTGVIVSPDGYILVGGGVGSIDAKVHLSDGRTVTATAAGWSSEWRLDVIKIHEEGPWPAIEWGSTTDLKAGEPCVVIGYSPRGDTNFDSSPTVRFGFVDRIVRTRWFTTTCFPGFYEGAAVVGMDGRLLGVDNDFLGSQSYATAVDEIAANRDHLFAGKNLDWVRYPPNLNSIYRIGAGEHPEMLRWRKTDDLLSSTKTPEPMSDSQLAEVKQIALKTTVRLVSKDRLLEQGGPERWSGVIVSEDGYIVTCAHTEQLPGERLTVQLSDGRDVDAVALGTTRGADVGLVKITTSGKWPFAEVVESSTLKPGDPLVVAGYPAINNITKKEWSIERIPQIDTTMVRLPPYLLWNGEFRTTGRTDFPYQGGMSGGGVFSRDGRYVGILQGNDAPTCTELALVRWNELKHIQSIDTAMGMPHSLQKRFVAPSQPVARSVVEILVDSHPVSIGTIIDSEGWILTKASVLNGNVSVRLQDQSVAIAEKRAESQEYDLALLKIDVGGLPAVEFSDKEPPSIAEALCAVEPRAVLKPGIVSVETRAVPPEPRWKGDTIEDTQDGAMISRSVHGSKNKTNLSTIGTKLQDNDIIVSINGHSTPNVATLTQVLETKLSAYCTGDLVSVSIRRNGSPMNVLTSLPRASVVNYWRVDEHDTPRRSGFVAIYDTDIELFQHEVGCPVIDVEGRVRGIAIASRGRNETQRGPTSVLPSDTVRHVTKQLMARP